MSKLLAGVRVFNHLVMVISLSLLHIFVLNFHLVEFSDNLLNVTLTAFKRLISTEIGLEVSSNVYNWLKNLFTVEFISILKQICLYLHGWIMLIFYAFDSS